jgi:hypothetical protein
MSQPSSFSAQNKAVAARGLFLKTMDESCKPSIGTSS